MINQDKISEALLFAAKKHEGQKMKQPDVSYLAHLQGVCLEVVGGYLNSNKFFDIEKAIIISLLHDSIEDTNTTFEEIKNEFGEDIAKGVKALTKDESLPNEIKMMDSINRIKEQSVEVAIVKLADRLFNLKDVPFQWNKDKVLKYKEEAILILKELGYANEYMAKRLQDKIESYNKEV